MKDPSLSNHLQLKWMSEKTNANFNLAIYEHKSMREEELINHPRGVHTYMYDIAFIHFLHAR